MGGCRHVRRRGAVSEQQECSALPGMRSPSGGRSGIVRAGSPDSKLLGQGRTRGQGWGVRNAGIPRKKKKMNNWHEQLTTVGIAALAAFFGALIGFEREIWGKPAGLRTHALIAFSCAMFIEVGRFLSSTSNAAGHPPVGASDRGLRHLVGDRVCNRYRGEWHRSKSGWRGAAPDNRGVRSCAPGSLALLRGFGNSSLPSRAQQSLCRSIWWAVGTSKVTCTAIAEAHAGGKRRSLVTISVLVSRKTRPHRRRHSVRSFREEPELTARPEKTFAKRSAHRQRHSGPGQGQPAEPA